MTSHTVIKCNRQEFSVKFLAHAQTVGSYQAVFPLPHYIDPGYKANAHAAVHKFWHPQCHGCGNLKLNRKLMHSWSQKVHFCEEFDPNQRVR